MDRPRRLVSDSIHVRAFTLDDLHDIAELLSQPNVVRGTMQLPFRGIEQRRAWAERALDDPDQHSLVAEVDGKVVGNLGLQVQKAPRRRHVGAIGMMVHDAHAGRGIGAALMSAAVELSDRWLNLRRLELEVYVDNEPAIALYLRFGFELEGTIRDMAFRDGSYVDAYVMGRLRRQNLMDKTCVEAGGVLQDPG